MADISRLAEPVCTTTR